MFEKIWPGAISSYSDNNSIFFTGMNINGLFEFNLETRKTKCLFVSRYNLNNSVVSSGKIVRNNQKLIIYPLMSNVITEYDIDSGKTDYVEIPQYLAVKRYHKEIYHNSDESIIFPGKYGENVLTHDYKTNRIFTNDKLTDILTKIGNGEKSIIYICEDVLYAYVNITSMLYRINLNDHSILKSEIPKMDEVDAIYVKEETVWFTHMKKLTIHSFELNTKTRNEYIPQNVGWQKDKQISPYSNLVFYKNQVILENYYADSICEVDCSNKEIRPICYMKWDLNASKFGGAFGSYEIIDDKIVFLSVMSKKGVILFDGVVDLFELSVDITEDRVINKTKYLNDIFYERHEEDLGKYINYIGARYNDSNM